MTEPKSEPYWQSQKPRIFAHRGLALTAAENTIEAFKAAVEAGATHLESDIRISQDGVPILFHDLDLKRTSGIPKQASELSLADLQKLELEKSGRICTLEEALLALPQAKFNLDLKDLRACRKTAEIILKLKAQNRVLITSFSKKRREAALEGFTRTPPTSASAAELLKFLFAGFFGFKKLAAKFLRTVDAVQIPTRILFFDTASKKAIANFHAAGVEVHFWTINDPVEMKKLLAAGADGIVTDRADIAAQTLHQF